MSHKKISEGDLGFRIGPRINAAGRMGMTDLAVRLFFSDSLEESRDLVKQLEELNSRRQRTEEKIFDQARSKIEEKGLADRYKCLVLGSEEWHRGVIGIVASKLKDRFHRPVILFTYDDGMAFGSGRSISECPLIDLIEGCRRYFQSFGGHRLAVGCSLRTDDMPAFKAAINELAGPRISEDDLRRKIRIDTPIGLDSLNFSFLEHYDRLVPFGVGNPKPVFLTEGIEVMSEPKKMQGRHVKFWVKQNGRTFEALGWDKADWAGRLSRGDKIDLAYHAPRFRISGGGEAQPGRGRHPEIGERHEGERPILPGQNGQVGGRRFPPGHHRRHRPPFLPEAARSRRVPRRAGAGGPPPGEDIDRKEGVEHVLFKGDKGKIKVKADEFYLGEDKLNHLEGNVEVVDYGNTGGQEIIMLADQVDYDQDLNNFQATGRARIKDKDALIESPSFDLRQEGGGSSGPTRASFSRRTGSRRARGP